MSQVNFKDVKKSYGEVTVIECLNLDIEPEEFMVLVGPSGCGKSTALRMVAGLEEITDGTVSIGDRVVNDLPPKERDIAMVFQSYALYPHMSVRQNLEFGLRLKKTPQAEIDNRVNKAAEILGITPFLDRRPKQLSGGQRQRVAVGRAIVRNPSVFLFDEPLSNLDAKLRVQMRAEIAKLQKRLKTTTVYVTHDQVEAMTMGDRIAILKDGDLQQVGSPLDVYQMPANMFVASFIGSVNLLACSGPGSGGGKFHCSTLETAVRLPAAGDAAAAPHGAFYLAVRPEKMRLHREEPDGVEEDVAAGRIEEITYLGAHSTYHVRTVAGTLIQVTLPMRTRADRDSFTREEPVWVSWSPDSAVLLPA